MQEWINNIIGNATLRNLIIIALGIVMILIIVKIIKRSLGKYVKADNWYRTKKAINIIGYILVILLFAIVYQDSLGGITVVLGVAGAGIAFALQEVITSIAGWIAIMFGGFYKAGDRVLLGGIRGDVIDLGVLRTTVMELGEWVDGDLYNGRIVRIANSFVFKEPVFNYSSDFPFLWDEIKIPIKYGSDYELARNILDRIGNEVIGDYARNAKHHWEEMVRKFEIENASTDVSVTVAATDNWVEFTIRYVVDYKQRRAVQDQMFTKILKAVSDSGGAISFASATFDITALPKIDLIYRDETQQDDQL